MALEAVGSRVPVLTFVGHLSLVHANVLPTGITEFRKHSLKAYTTKWSAITHDVALTPELSVALETGEVLHVPAPCFRLCALISKDYLQLEKIDIS